MIKWIDKIPVYDTVFFPAHKKEKPALIFLYFSFTYYLLLGYYNKLIIIFNDHSFFIHFPPTYS